MTWIKCGVQSLLQAHGHQVKEWKRLLLRLEWSVFQIEWVNLTIDYFICEQSCFCVAHGRHHWINVDVIAVQCACLVVDVKHRIVMTGASSLAVCTIFANKTKFKHFMPFVSGYHFSDKVQNCRISYKIRQIM